MSYYIYCNRNGCENKKKATGEAYITKAAGLVSTNVIPDDWEEISLIFGTGCGLVHLCPSCSKELGLKNLKPNDPDFKDKLLMIVGYTIIDRKTI